MMKYAVFSRVKTLNIAHRGYEAKAPENTIVAFRKAMDAGADGVELDLQMTKDGHLIVMHDPTLDRTTNGKGKVKYKTLAELKELDAGSWFDPSFAAAAVPTLDEVLERLPQRAVIAIETKPFRANRNIAGKIIASVKAHRAEKRVIILSYNPVVLAYCKRICPEVPVMLIHDPHPAKEWVISLLRIVSRLRPDIRSLEWFVIAKRKTAVARLHSRGVKVFCGVSPTEKEMRLMRDTGVDGMMTSDPVVLRRVLEEKRKK